MKKKKNERILRFFFFVSTTVCASIHIIKKAGVDERIGAYSYLSLRDGQVEGGTRQPTNSFSLYVFFFYHFFPLLSRQVCVAPMPPHFFSYLKKILLSLSLSLARSFSPYLKKRQQRNAWKAFFNSFSVLENYEESYAQWFGLEIPPLSLSLFLLRWIDTKSAYIVFPLVVKCGWMLWL